MLGRMTHETRRGGWLLVLGLFMTATARAEPPAVDDVRALLSGYEAGPSDAELRALGSEAPITLQALYARQDELPFIRLRAVEAMAAFPTPETRAFLKHVASDTNQSDLFVRIAVVAMVRAFGDAALPDVEPYLRSDRPVIREAAVRAVGRMHSPAARRAFRACQTLRRDRR